MTDTAVFEVDERYECDAPRHYDFDENSTGSSCSSWFEAQHEVVREAEEADAACESREPLGEVQNQPATKKTNIVTSWGAEVAKKRKGGAAEQPVSKAAKTSRDDVTEPRTRAQHAVAAAAAKAKSKSRSKAAKELRVVKTGMKSKGPKSKKLKAARVTDVLRPLRILPTRSTKQLTVPQELELHTSKRAAAHGSATQVEQTDGHGEDETDAGGTSSPYKPLAQRVKEFDKTPGRFKRQPEQPPPPKPLVITEPKEPQLRTSNRTRPTSVKPREVLEAEEMANMPVFKASTLNPLILTSSGLLGVPTVDKRGPTEQKPFAFVTDDRAEARAARQLKQQAAEAGPSRPQQQQAASGRDGDQAEQALPKKARKSVAYQPTEPRSPALHTKLRAREIKVEEPRFEFHARPVPKYLSVPSLDMSHVHEPPVPTQPEPFRLATEQRGAYHRNNMSARLAAEEQEAKRARIPRAQGLPLSTDMPLVPPKPESRPLTIPEPFALASEARHQQFEEEKRKRLEEEEAAKREAAEFKARPMWRGIPFRVHDPEVPLTVPEEVPLHTSARAAEREVFNKVIEDKRREAEIAAQKAAEEARLREEEERKQLRKEAQFKARPMPDLSAAPAAKPPPPTKPLTKPVSPKLGRKKRRNSSG